VQSHSPIIYAEKINALLSEVDSRTAAAALSIARVVFDYEKFNTTPTVNNVSDQVESPVAD
jgi:hypothetical protein